MSPLCEISTDGVVVATEEFCNNYTYAGGVWHNTTLQRLPREQDMYLCVTDGCPDAGAHHMKCKQVLNPLISSV